MNDKELMEQDQKEAERLRQWAEEQELLRIANQQEADELAILIAEELLKPKIEERVQAVETKTVTIEETLEVIFGG